MATPDSYSYKLRAINAGIHLQALILKHHKLTGKEVKKLRVFKEVAKAIPFSNLSLETELKERKGIEGRLYAFMAQNFFKIEKDDSLVPDRHTYEVIINNHCAIAEPRPYSQCCMKWSGSLGMRLQ